MTPGLAWTLLVVWIAGLIHVAASPQGGAWRSPAGSRCPIAPRLGWLVLALMLGPVGWMLFLRSRRRVPAPSRPPSPS
ncbi:MAG: hypothetical protein JNK67_16445 [Alphaproteobacteria bacterium]|nr:hypothetical protein [Alphaproteobacteria bacterium]